jgi:hypothetical protein
VAEEPEEGETEASIMSVRLFECLSCRHPWNAMRTWREQGFARCPKCGAYRGLEVGNERFPNESPGPTDGFIILSRGIH